MGDAAEIEHEHRVQRILALHVEDDVVGDMNERIAERDRRHEQECGALEVEAHGPDRVGDQQRCREHRRRPQQDAEPDQRQRRRCRQPTPERCAVRARIDDRGGQQPRDREQYVAPDHAEQHEGGRREGEERQEHAEHRRAARDRERDQGEGEPVGCCEQQEHAARAGGDRIDHPPEYAHERGLPVAEAPFQHVPIDVGGVVGQVARMEHRQREREARHSHRDDEPAG